MLIVPDEAIPAYKMADVWKDFGEIIGIGSPQAIEDYTNESLQTAQASLYSNLAVCK